MNTSAQWSPMFQKYIDAKRRTDAIIAWQMGDFFEFYFEDAKTVSEVCGIAISRRGSMPNGDALPMCGVPADTRFSVGHERILISLTPTDHYFGQIVEAGHPLAVAVYADGRDGRNGWKIVATFDPADFVPVSVRKKFPLPLGAA